jgi:hypothetical protein
MKAWMMRFARLDRESITIALVLGLLLLALTMPRVELPRDSYSYIVVFDISQSMNVEDYELDGVPVSRLDYARDAGGGVRTLQRSTCFRSADRPAHALVQRQ